MGPQLLPPSSSLPPLRGSQLDAAQILCAIDNLFAIYYPAPPETRTSVLYEAALKLPAVPCKPRLPAIARLATPNLPDSGYSSPGYISEDEDDKDDEPTPPETAPDLPAVSDNDSDREILRADEFERSFATRWLEKFITRASDECDDIIVCFSSDESRQGAVDRAADLLTFLLNPPEETTEEAERGGADGEEEEEEDVFCRDLKFALNSDLIQTRPEIYIKINDGLAGSSSSADHTDVGVQTWGASIVLCQMMCDSPGRFGISAEKLGKRPRIVELGAGTGVVSLVLGQLLPLVGVYGAVLVATDYHLGVMANLRRNIGMNQDVHVGSSAGDAGQCPVHAYVLDWARPELLDEEEDWPLNGGANGNADVLFATDVVYAKEHAQLLYDCASRLLAPDGVFWLLQTVRENGRLGEYADAVGAVFPRSDDEGLGSQMLLKILESEKLEKRNGVGRGDETFYRLFKIGWA